MITEFYTPIVPKGYDFLREIGKLAGGRRFVPVPPENNRKPDDEDTEEVILDERYD